ncbi:MAG: dolichyl-phosphate beta-glucosyltransferase [Terriglobales bacterium]
MPIVLRLELPNIDCPIPVAVANCTPRNSDSQAKEAHRRLEFTYSIVLPAYNEGARIGETLQRILAFVGKQGWNAEVIVVNDGSTDNTAEIVRLQGVRNPVVRLIDNPGNRGKGYSVRNGMLHAQGEILLFSDADLSSPIEEAPRLFAAIKQGADIAIGSRWLRPELQTTRQPLRRQIFGRVFNLALRIILGLDYRDSQCGFKAFNRRAVDIVFPMQKIERWGFDPEILFLARTFGLRVEEVPVMWAHRQGGSIHPVRDGIRMVGEMVNIRWNALTGKYKPTRMGLKSYSSKL